MSSFLPSQWYKSNHREAYLYSKPDDPQRRKTLLEQIETSVDPLTAKRLDMLRQAKQDTLDHIRAYYSGNSYESFTRHLQRCSTTWAVWQTEDGLQAHPLRCRQRMCPICQRLRSATMYKLLEPIARAMMPCKHITLTLKASTDPLPEQIHRLYACFRRLRQRKDWSSRSPWGYYILEVTYNPSTRQWHPHLHVIGCLRFLPWKQLRAIWHDITADSFETDIRAVKGNIAKYITKYVTKANSIWMSATDPDALRADMKGVRMLNRFGKWPIKLNRDPRPSVFVGTVPFILRHAARGDSAFYYLADWLLREHPAAIADALRRPPPLPPECFD